MESNINDSISATIIYIYSRENRPPKVNYSY
jgi:hypothetical protein